MKDTLKQFSMVRCADVKTAKRLKAQNVPAVLFFDGDGKELFRNSVRSEEGMKSAIDIALKKYASKDVSWASGDYDTVREQAAQQEKILMLAFVDKKNPKKLSKLLADRWVVRYHDRFVFMSFPFDSKSEICKKWGVRAGSTLLAVNPLEKDKAKAVLGKTTGPKHVRKVRDVMLRAIEKFEKSRKE